MKFTKNNSAKMNEIIFENRNKNYGAYQLRANYDDALLKSVLLLLAFLSLLIIGVVSYNKQHAVIDEKIVIDIATPNLPDIIYTPIDVTPLIERPIVEPAQKAAAAAPNTGISTNFNNNAVATQTTNINNTNIGLGVATATGTSLTGTLTIGVPIILTAPINTIAVKVNADIYVAEEMPEFAGGVKGLMQHIANNINYPEVAKVVGKEGTVHVSFVVNETGNVEGVKILKGIGYGCDEEVMRVITKLPTWKKVGKNNGKAVKVRFNIPVRFSLQ